MISWDVELKGNYAMDFEAQIILYLLYWIVSSLYAVALILNCSFTQIAKKRNPFNEMSINLLLQ